MARTRLDGRLLQKLADKTGKKKQHLRVRISQRASKQGISSAAAQIVWAQQLGLGVAHALSKLEPQQREEVRSSRSSLVGTPSTLPRVLGPRGKKSTEPITAAAIDSLLHDPQLHGRCKDLLQARKHFDRVIREATTVLDDRLKKKSGISNVNPLSLVGKALSPDPQKAVLEVSAEKDEQEGLHSIVKGIMLAFRNRAHHSLSDKFTREDALKVCGFIDTMLGIVERPRFTLSASDWLGQRIGHEQRK